MVVIVYPLGPLFINIGLGLNAINGYHSAMITNHESKYQTNLLFVRHPLPGFELGSPTMIRTKNKIIDALDRSAMDPLDSEESQEILVIFNFSTFIGGN